ncbi:putative type IV secretion system protein [endosymbiont of Acanthamoeba sp. UWC8]|uniref:type IV secretion system protein n=1 Tax=endosymbiont of Acanthamoeba sp. UWC8 TaxID=86106 RepID=UPI0004D0DF13|nr:type IV secretion system protein [endosymbiont of Acanthamoeba sp. UWC8]AIF81926.1 putative type IV secretion system protein [endosymbiont of Acanthamoeba sp. UWC8]
MPQLLNNILAIVIIFTCKVAFAGSFYTNCIAGNDFGGSNKIENMVLTPLNPVCQDRCNIECNSFSREINGVELNQSVITACKTDCQNGVYYSSSYYDIKDASTIPPTIEIKPPVAIQTHCGDNEWAKNNTYATNINVKKGDKIRLSIAGNASANVVYLCGKQDVSFQPIFSSSKPSDWENNSSQTQWTSPAQHECLYYMSNSEWNSLTNYKLWSLNYSPLSQRYPSKCVSGQTNNQTNNEPIDIDWINEKINATNLGTSTAQSAPDNSSFCKESIPSNLNSIYGPCKWSARNYNYTDTGINVADGDELSISWSGRYSHFSHDLGELDTNGLAKCMTDPKKSSTIRKACFDSFYADSSIQIKPARQSGFNLSSIPGIVMNGEATRLTPIGTTSFQTDPKVKRTTLLGLQGSVFDENLKTTFLTGIPGCMNDATITDPNIAKIKNSDKAECVQIDDLGTPHYNYSGILKGFSSERTPLAIRHNDGHTDIETMKMWYSDNFGGYNVDISWGGCPKYNGENVQYAVASSGSAITESMWKDVPQSSYLQGNYLNIDFNDPGTLFFRIKTITPPAGSSAEIKKLYESPGSYFGQYYIVAELLKPDATITCGTICEFINMIHDVLVGSGDGRPGAAQSIFSSITRDAQYIGLVRALLVFYVAFFGVGFLIGTIKLNQQEAVIRMVKVGVIITLISPNSWDFFGTYLLNMFIEGGIELIAIIVSGSFSSEVVNVTRDPFAVFSLFDGPISQIFSSAVWKKIYALICTGLLGLIVALVVMYCAIIYVLSLLKATLVYIYSLVGIALLITTAPIFICCLLFEITKSLFDSWWKYLISYTLQPVMVFAAIAIFNLVIMVLLYTCLNFTACEFCILGIDLGSLYNECWIPGYRTTLAMNVPGDVPNFFMPGNVVSTALAFALLGNSMYKFTGFIAGVCGVLITGNFREASAAAPADATMSAMKNTVKTAISTTTQMASAGIKTAGAVGDAAAPGVGQVANKAGEGVEQAGEKAGAMLDSVMEKDKN